MTDIREIVAKAIGDVSGFPFDEAFEHKPAWVRAHGQKGGRFHDINEPFQSEMLEQAQAALQAIESNGFAIVPVEPSEAMQAAALRSFVGGHTSPAEIHKAMLTAYKEGK